MIRNFKRTAAIFGLVAATSTALVACNDSNDSGSDNAEGGSDAAETKEVSGDLSGEGASSQKSAMSVFEKAFLGEYPDANFSYTSSGSGAGVKAFNGGTVDFAGSDSALKEDKGEITKWNDDAIKAENEGTDLPEKDITVIFRSDESGTSDNFQKFLKSATGNWDSEGKQFPDAVGEGANGSSGVADQVASIDGAITYVEAGYAHQKEGDGVKIAKIDFGNGPVELSSESVGVALDHLAFKETGSEHNMVVDSEKLFASDDEGAYPLILTTYNIVCSAGYDEETSALVKAFFNTVLDNQNEDLENAGFIPVSGDHLERLKAAVEAIQ